MLQTAKSILLMDENGVNISPITDVTSLYYEVIDENQIVSRKFIYSGFPVAVKYSDETIISEYSTKAKEESEELFTAHGQYVVNKDDSDIVVSGLVMEQIKGTNYYQINTKNYNLTQILYNYSTVKDTDKIFEDVKEKVTIINKDIKNLAELTKDIDAIINIKTFTSVDAFISLMDEHLLIPGKYYSLPYAATYKDGNTPVKVDYAGNVIIRANSENSVDNIVYGLGDLDIYANFEFMTASNKTQCVVVTYMRDTHGNEANYDFINLKVNGATTFGQYGLANATICNNIIKVNPIEDVKHKNPTISYINIPATLNVLNNVFGAGSIISIDGGSGNERFVNNIIGSNNTFLTPNCLVIENNIIGNNNSIIFSDDANLSNCIIGNNNAISNNEATNIDKSTFGNSNTVNLSTPMLNSVIIEDDVNVTFDNPSVAEYHNILIASNTTVLPQYIESNTCYQPNALIIANKFIKNFQ